MSKSEELFERYNPMSQKASMTDIAFDTGVIAERNRIIKLLEMNIDEIGCCNCGMKNVIKLVKGETK